MDFEKQKRLTFQSTCIPERTLWSFEKLYNVPIQKRCKSSDLTKFHHKLGKFWILWRFCASVILPGNKVDKTLISFE